MQMQVGQVVYIHTCDLRCDPYGKNLYANRAASVFTDHGWADTLPIVWKGENKVALLKRPKPGTTFTVINPDTNESHFRLFRLLMVPEEVSVSLEPVSGTGDMRRAGE